MIEFDDFFTGIVKTPLKKFQPSFAKILQEQFYSRLHGDMDKWQDYILQFPRVIPNVTKFNTAAIKIGSSNQLSKEDTSKFYDLLKKFMPWRKGPWDLFGIQVDTEWQSNMKWNRIRESISPLKDRLVLDVGCGNGYYGFRMLAQEPGFVLGIDPTQLFLMQYRIIKAYLPNLPIAQLPLKDDALPGSMHCFDTVFSMGVLYHRRDPMQHLSLLRDALRKGGELVLESLVLESVDEILRPEGRYAKMRNVWTIPSYHVLASWIEQAGFKNVQIVDITKTSPDEQRVTRWMEFESLENFLDPENNALTIEGHPAPVRAIFIATAR